MKLRTFEDHDYWAWAGVETDSPLIGESDSLICVIDGEHLHLSCLNDPEDSLGCEQFIVAKMPSHGVAMLFALGLRGDETSEEMNAIMKEWGGLGWVHQ